MEIHFLAYFNRSGSTLLAKKLNEFKDIVVSLEAKFRQNVIDNFRAYNNSDLEKWLDVIYKDHKFNRWNVTKDELISNLLKKSKPIEFNDFLCESLKLFAKNESPAKIIFFKSRTFWGDLKKTEKLFPDAKHIFIDRDPRAIYNSQAKSIDSRTQKVMQSDIEKFAPAYKWNQKRLQYYFNNDNLKNKFILVKYENLIINEGNELNKIIDFFNISSEKLAERNYSDIIPNEQKHLHKNLNSGNKKERIYAWRNELDKKDIRYLELVLRSDLLRNGYELNNKKLSHNFLEIKLLLRGLKFYFKFYPKHIIKVGLITLGFRKKY